MSDALQSEKPATGRARLEPPDISELGGIRNGQPQRSDERLFVQLLAFGNCHDPRAVSAHLAGSGVEHVVYEDLNDPTGIGIVSFSTDPNAFLDGLRPRLSSGPLAALTAKPQYTTLGRTYALGYE